MVSHNLDTTVIQILKVDNMVETNKVKKEHYLISIELSFSSIGEDKSQQIRKSLSKLKQ